MALPLLDEEEGDATLGTGADDDDLLGFKDEIRKIFVLIFTEQLGIFVALNKKPPDNISHQGVVQGEVE